MKNSKQVRHLAVIMDGNGRWARKRGFERIKGHAVGAEAAISLVESCVRQEIEEVTLYALSVENMSRDEREVQFITDLLVKTLLEKKQSLHDNGVRVKIIGNKRIFGEKICKVIDQVEQYTKNNSKLCLNIAFNYSGRWQIEQAVLYAAKQTKVDSKSNIYDEFESYLRQEIQYDPDLLIRTGGDKRLSNFMLWHLAYTELFFSDVLWPDFDEHVLSQALATFGQRERRFGQVTEDKSQAKSII